MDINCHTAWINADQTKGGQTITVLSNKTAQQVLANRPQNSVCVFTKADDKRLHSISSRIWKGCLKEAGIENFR